MADIINPSGEGGSSEAKRTVGGWKAMQEKKTGNPSAPVESRQQRLIRESEEKAYNLKHGIKQREGGYRPGEDAPNGEFNMKRAKDAIRLLTEAKKTQKVFKGKAELCMTKMSMLFNGDDEIAAARNLVIVKVEQAGFTDWKITYTCD